MTVTDIKEMIRGLEDHETVVLVREKKFEHPLLRRCEEQ